MENATKALIIAGAILVTLLVISLGVYIFNNYAGEVVEQADLTEQEISAFNNQITPYLGQNISGSQVNALIQTVISIDNNANSSGNTIQRVNLYYEDSSTTRKLLVGFDSSGNLQTGSNVQTGVFYTVTGTYDSNGLITTIDVTKN